MLVAMAGRGGRKVHCVGLFLGVGIRQRYKASVKAATVSPPSNSEEFADGTDQQ